MKQMNVIDSDNNSDSANSVNNDPRQKVEMQKYDYTSLVQNTMDSHNIDNNVNHTIISSKQDQEELDRSLLQSIKSSQFKSDVLEKINSELRKRSHSELQSEDTLFDFFIDTFENISKQKDEKSIMTDNFSSISEKLIEKMKHQIQSGQEIIIKLSEEVSIKTNTITNQENNILDNKKEMESLLINIDKLQLSLKT